MASELPEGVVIVGVNEFGFEGGNELFTEGRDLPWLQDTEEVDVWSSWDVDYRDVMILDRENHYVDRFNLSANDLSDPAAYDELRALLESI